MSALTATPQVPYVDLAGQHQPLKAELLQAVAQVIDSGQFILGPQVAELETRLAQLCGVKFAIGVSNGTDALILALRVLGVGVGDQVITVPNTFIATAAAIVLVGAQPVLVDVRDDLNLDPRKLEQAITPKTKAILPVHLTGRPADMGPIREIAQRHGLFIVEDAAQAILAEYHGRRVGALGTLGCFSMHPLKTLNALGDAGFITTDDPELDRRLRRLRNLGLRSREQCATWSGNCRLDTVQAALLLVKLPHLENWTLRRRENAELYRQLLAGVNAVRAPVDQPGEKAVYHTFVIQADRRDELQKFLAAHGVQTAIHYPIPIHLQDAGRELGYAPGSFPVAERLARRILSLPVYPELQRPQIEGVAARIREFYKNV